MMQRLNTRRNGAKPRRAIGIITNAEGSPRLPIAPHDALELWNKKLLQRVDQHTFSAPRSWRQICHGEFPPLHPDVTALIAKAQNKEITNES